MFINYAVLPKADRSETEMGERTGGGTGVQGVYACMEGNTMRADVILMSGGGGATGMGVKWLVPDWGCWLPWNREQEHEVSVDCHGRSDHIRDHSA